MDTESAWKNYTDEDLASLEKLASDYIDYISENKIEREFARATIRDAEAAGYESLAAAYREGRRLRAGDKV